MSLVARIVLSLAVVIGLATPGPAQVAEWNQKDVTAVSQQLEEATKELYDSFYKQPTQGIGTGQARAYQELKQQLRRIRQETRHLASSLTRGEDHDETLPIYRNLMEEVRDAEENARRVFSTGPVIEKANVAREALEKLSSYYTTEEAS
jgi:DNA repair exonuclease SbcCD ATPase subunit